MGLNDFFFLFLMLNEIIVYEMETGERGREGGEGEKWKPALEIQQETDNRFLLVCMKFCLFGIYE